MATAIGGRAHAIATWDIKASIAVPASQVTTRGVICVTLNAHVQVLSGRASLLSAVALVHVITPLACASAIHIEQVMTVQVRDV